MSNQSIQMGDALYQYMLDASLRETDVQRRLRERTAEMPNANMQIAPEQGQFMALLVKLINARRVLEIGTFTGYSALSVALALPPDGTLVACDVSAEWTSIGQTYWEEAGIADKIDLRLGPASVTLGTLITQGEEETFDFAFIDADKTGYVTYYEHCLRLVRPGGLIAIDNAFMNGTVLDDSPDAHAKAIRVMNDKLHNDDRVDVSLVPIGDGLYLARRRLTPQSSSSG